MAWDFIKKDSKQVFFCEIYETLKYNFFSRTPLVPASGYSI